MKKEILISLVIVSGILLLSSISYADGYEELKATLEAYIQDPSLDFLGGAYGSLGWLAGLKSSLGASKFNKMVFKIGKSLFR